MWNNNGNGMFGNSMPTATQPYGYAMGGYIQPQMQPQPTQQPQTPQIATNVIFVSGLDEVKMRAQPANSRYVYFDNDRSILYQKTVDGTGHFELEQFDLTARNAENATVEPQSIDTSQFVLRKDFEALQGQIRALENKMRGGVVNGNTGNNGSVSKSGNL